jgi:branched-chain amino acid transport system substrate-binding protein
MINDDDAQGRRTFLKGVAGASLSATLLAGCTQLTGGGNGNGNDTNSYRVPGLYDLSGGTSDVGRPTGIGSRDAIKWINENADFEASIEHPWNDYAYEVSQASQYYDQYTSDGDPPMMIGWGTADTEALAQQVAEDEIVYVSASYSANLLTDEAPYNFFGNLDYTSQARAHLKNIADTDSGAKVAFIFSNNPFGQAPVEGGKQYAEELGLEVGEDINLPLTANSATSQLRRARDNNIEYLIHQNTAAPMQVLMSDRQDVYPDVTVCGLTYTVDEFRAQESPDVFEGARYVNAFRTFQGALDEGGQGASIIEDSFEREGRSMDNSEIANLNYVRGIIHALLVFEGLRSTVEAGGDPTSGADVRQGMFGIENNEMGGLSQPYSYAEDDRRPTMTGRLFEVSDGALDFDTTVELPRRDDWIGL